MIKERKGDIFAAPTRVLVNPVNCVGVMGKGLALAFKDRFPDAYKSYRRACLAGELRPGRLHAHQLPDGRWIVHFPTKDHWRDPSRMDYVDAGLVELVDWIQSSEIESIAIPALGCGLGGLPWTPGVKQRIEAAFASIEVSAVEVWLFGPER